MKSCHHRRVALDAPRKPPRRVSPYAGLMRKTLPVALGVLMVVIGAIWTLQGLGYLEGSAMTGVELWAVLGPVVAGLGVALLIVALRPRR